MCDEQFSGALKNIKVEICACLQEFDSCWVELEQIYVHDLMATQSDAKGL